MIKGVTHSHLGLILYHSEPSNVPYFPNQQLVMNFFCRFLQQTGSKGQLILLCPYEMIVLSKIPTKLFLDFCPEIFRSFLGASWKLFGLPVGFLIYDITH